MRTIAYLACFAGLTFAAGQVSALEYRSVGAHPAICYDLPQATSKKLAIASRGMPLEIVIDNADWVKVRDSAGKMSWMESKALDKRRTLMVTVPTADVHLSADVASSVLFKVAQNVLLELKQNTETGWLEVRHPDGISGYIRSNEVWGE
ncbi:SH3 domain-containing protein [Ferriphaselus sp. R-1]|uniref:SH3 domain-containing protein n=1 Tax=Ferriphaselus sp. R-1 TaxID=1485544 RepID=UPI00054F01B3|nr:SH3 domain-containing protein [Ferriphaselus sp. R-1]